MVDASIPGTRLFFGNLYDEVLFAQNNHAGLQVSLPIVASLGTPIVADDDYLVKDATSTELPNNATITYTGATDNTTPLDGVAAAPTTLTMADGVDYLLWSLDVPRNIICHTTHNSSIVAMTVTIDGFDVYKRRLVETITVAATGTDEADVGLKAFKYVKSIAIASASDATANTLDVGVGDVLGLPFRLTNKAHLQVWFDGAVDAAVKVLGVDTTPTATTGDVRGTIDVAGTLNGSKEVFVQHIGIDVASRATALGKDQYHP